MGFPCLRRSRAWSIIAQTKTPVPANTNNAATTGWVKSLSCSAMAISQNAAEKINFRSGIGAIPVFAPYIWPRDHGWCQLLYDRQREEPGRRGNFHPAGSIVDDEIASLRSQ